MKKKMSSLFAVLLTFGMVLGLTACGGDSGSGGGGGDSGSTSSKKVTGEPFETSLMSALTPSGWMAFPKADYFGDYPDEPGDPHGIRLHKGAKEEFDQFTTPGIQIDYFEDGTEMYDTKLWYEDIEEMDPITTGDYTWEAFSTESEDTDIIVLSTTEPKQIQVTIFPTLGDKAKISLKDADVQAILSSIAIK